MGKLSYDEKKIDIERFKKKLIDYFKKYHHDVTLSELFKKLELNLEDLNLLQYCLDELVKEGFLKKEASIDHYEYELTREHGGFVE